MAERPIHLKRTRLLLILILIAFLLVPAILVPGPRVEAQGDSCSYAPDPRLTVGGSARVVVTSENRLRIRSEAGLSGTQVAALVNGDTVDILDGPVCADGYYWWQVATNEGVIGWAAEGDFNAYYLTPIRGLAPTPDTADLTCENVLPPQGIIGDILSVTFAGQPVTAYELPNLEASQVSSWWAGHTLTIVDGPTCGGGRWWWRVELPDAQLGWIIVGDDVQYFVEIVPPTATPTATLTETPTSTPTLTPSLTNTRGPRSTGTIEASDIPTETATASPTLTPTTTATTTPTETPTETPTLAPSLTPLPTITPSPTVDTTCWTALQPRLEPGDTGQITATVDALRLRLLPSPEAGQVAVLRSGATFIVSEGPSCNGGYYWYRITLTETSESGWVAEGTTDQYWLESADAADTLLAEQICVAWADNTGIYTATAGEVHDVRPAIDDVQAVKVSPNGRFMVVLHGDDEAHASMINLASGDSIESTLDIPVSALGSDPNQALHWQMNNAAALINVTSALHTGVLAVSLFGDVSILNPLNNWHVIGSSPDGTQLGLVRPEGWGAAVYDIATAAIVLESDPGSDSANEAQTVAMWLDSGELAVTFTADAASATEEVIWTALLDPASGSTALNAQTRNIAAVRWAPTSTPILYTLNSGGMWLTTDLQLPGSLLIPVTPDGLITFEFTWSPSGRYMLYHMPVDVEQPNSVLDIQNGMPIPLLAEDNNAYSYQWTHDDLLFVATNNAINRLINQPGDETFAILNLTDNTLTPVADLHHVLLQSYDVVPLGCAD
jgi:hypothetical protein